MPSLYLRYKYSELFVFNQCILVLLSYVAWIIVAIFLLPILLLFKLVQFLRHILIWLRREGDIVESSDYPFLLENKTEPHNVVALCQVNGTLDHKYIREIYRKKHRDYDFHRGFQKLTKMVVVKLNCFVWADEPDFSPDRHIVQYDGPILDSEDKRKKYLLELGLERFPETMSPWKIIVVNESEHENKTFIYFSVHHVLGDGFSLLGLFISFLDSQPKFISTTQKHGVMSDLTKRIIKGVLTGPLALLTLAISYISDNPFRLRTKQNHITSSSDRVFEHNQNISLDHVKKLKTALNCTVNDIILAAYSGGFRRYLMERNPGKNPDDVSIALSFNKRAARNLQKGNLVLSNHSAGALIPLPVSHASRSMRLMLCKNRCHTLKNSADGHTFDFIFSRFLSWIPYIFGKYAASALSLHCSAILSNIAGPIEPVYMNGSEVERLIATIPLMYSLGLTISVFSYRGKINSCIIADRSVVPNPKRLLQLVEEEVDLIENEINSKK